MIKDGGQGKVTSGRWVQVSRLGNPLMNGLLHPPGAQGSVERERTDGRPRPERSLPEVFLRPEPAVLLHALYGLPVPPTPRTDLAVLLPDTLKVRLDTPVLLPTDAAFLGNPNGALLGRTIADDVVDIYLQAARGRSARRRASPRRSFPSVTASTSPTAACGRSTSWGRTPRPGLTWGRPTPVSTATTATNGGATATSAYVGPPNGFNAGRTTTFMQPTPRK